MLERAKHIKSGGIVFRLYSRRRMDGFLAYDIPEINRIPLVRNSTCNFFFLMIRIPRISQESDDFHFQCLL